MCSKYTLCTQRDVANIDKTSILIDLEKSGCINAVANNEEIVMAWIFTRTSTRALVFLNIE